MTISAVHVPRPDFQEHTLLDFVELTYLNCLLFKTLLITLNLNLNLFTHQAHNINKYILAYSVLAIMCSDFFFLFIMEIILFEIAKLLFSVISYSLQMLLEHKILLFSKELWCLINNDQYTFY